MTATDDDTVRSALRSAGLATRALAIVAAATLLLGLDVAAVRVGVPGVSGAPTGSASAPSVPPDRPDPAIARPPRPVPVPTVVRSATPAAPSPLDVYEGLGAWVDVFDYALPYNATAPPAVTPDDVAAMADAGVRTLFIQTARDDPRSPGLYADEATLRALIAAAHANGLRVVGWYLPTLVDVGTDLARLSAMAALDDGAEGLDGIAIDIEARDVVDVDERNRRLVALSRSLRATASGPIAAIVLPPVVLDEVNPAYWPGFPWSELAPLYDVWLPMSYWTNRDAASAYRDAAVYTVENARRVRTHLGRTDAPVHVIGGIGDATTAADLRGFVAGANEVGALGLSLYDWVSADVELWRALGALAEADAVRS